ncbi:hypothetical protein HYX02_00115 [Candidatus Woesearchaeota archaeon]|nr:hypothetical protein [Candidatus Woesearchaeota archaeon]
MKRIKKLIKMSYYQRFVVEPLKRLAVSGKGKLIDAGKGEEQRVYLFRAGGRLCVTAMHHANEIFGTYQSVLETLASGAPMSAAPVVNADMFDTMYKKVGKTRALSDGDQNLLNFMFYQFLESENIGNLYPKWGHWGYGSHVQKPSFIGEIEHIVANSLVVIDIHNCVGEPYIIITAPIESELQREIERLLIEVIRANGNPIREGCVPIASGFQEIRKHVYAPAHNDFTILEFAKEHRTVNFALEVPAVFIADGRYNLADQARIIATNVEILSRVAELVH